jgi:hypothetical protein
MSKVKSWSDLSRRQRRDVRVLLRGYHKYIDSLAKHEQKEDTSGHAEAIKAAIRELREP